MANARESHDSRIPPEAHHDEGVVETRLAQHALDWLILLVAAMQTGFGPFVSVYLAGQGWTQSHIGVSLSFATFTAVVFQVPAGLLVDALRNKRALAGLGLLTSGASALVLSTWPTHWPVFGSEMLLAAAGALLGPVIAGISVVLVPTEALGKRLGRNARFAASGSALAAAMIGTAGLALPARTILLGAAGLALPALLVLHVLELPGTWPSASDHLTSAPGEKAPLRRVLTNKALVVLAVGVALFQLANAAMLPIAAADAVLRIGSRAATWTAAGILVSQIVVATLAPWFGHLAEVIGRRPILLLGFCAVPVRGCLLAISGAPELLPAIQAVDGVAGAAMGAVLGLVVADLSRNTGRFNLCLSVLGLVAGLGATLSTFFAGLVSDTFGRTITFLVLATFGLVATGCMALLLPETRVAPERRDGDERRHGDNSPAAQDAEI